MGVLGGPEGSWGGQLTPEVMMTDWKRSKTGLMAMEASRQLGGGRGGLINNELIKQLIKELINCPPPHKKPT